MVLGPIFHDFCRSLHKELAGYRTTHDTDNPIVLYVARAGLRLGALYRLFRDRRGLARICPEEPFYVSRISVAKACLLSDPVFVSNVIAREFTGASLGALVETVTCGRVRSNPEWERQASSATALLNLVNEDSDSAKPFRDYLAEQANLFAKYLVSLLGEEARLVLLVDSGWTGNTQWMLMRSFPQYQWRGLYVGKWDYRRVNPEHFEFLRGLVVDAGTTHRFSPAGTILRHYHLIEQPLEPPCRSVQEYRSDGVSVRADIDAPGTDALMGAAQDFHIRGVFSYFMKDRMQSDAEIVTRSDRALRHLRRAIRFPSRHDVAAMSVPDRSADFGKRLEVPVLISPQTATAKKLSLARFRRIRASLWKEGQVVLEFPVLSQLVFLPGRLLLRVIDRTRISSSTRP